MSDRRKKDINWLVADEAGKSYDVQYAILAVLMDLRDEMKRMNNILHCSNFLAMPFKLDRIARNTAKPKKRKRLKVAA